MRRCIPTLLCLWMGLVLAWTPPAAADDKPVLVVFLMESRGTGLKADEVVVLSDYLSAATVQSACDPDALINAVDEAVRQLLPLPQPRNSSVKFVATGKTTKRLPPDYDPKAFEPLPYLARAEALAKAEMGDAQFVDFDDAGVGSAGTIDLSLHKD